MMSTRSASVRPSAVALTGRYASLRDSGRRSTRGPSASVSSHSGMPARNLPTISNLAGVYRLQPPAGAMPVSVRARPRRSSSKATQPPSELPTMCAVSQPSPSIRRSTSSASAPEFRKNGPARAAVVPGHGWCEDLVAARRRGCRIGDINSGNQRRNLFPHVLRHHERMQQNHRLAGTQVNRCALGHAARH